MVFKSKLITYTLLGAFNILSIFSCTSYSNKNSDLPKISIRQGWFPWAGYAGEMVAVNETDSIFNISIRVDPGADDIDPIKMVISGENEIGITSAESVLLANLKGANLVAIATINYKSPTCFISLKSKGIIQPSDFEGKKIGILTGSETETVYRTLINHLKLNSKKITEVEAPYDLKTFINGAFDVYPGFIYAEPIYLRKQHIEINVIKPEDYGVQLMGAVYFTTRKMVNEKPELLQKFVNALSAGWERAINNPEKAIQYLKLYDKNISYENELLTLKEGISYFKGENDKILFTSEESWNTLAKALKDLGKLPDNFQVMNSFTNKFVNSYHEKK